MSNFIKGCDLKIESFYRFPKELMREEYLKMRLESKMAYVIILDRASLSMENGWVNEEGEIYVKIKRKTLMALLSIKGTQKMTMIMEELNDYGLIFEKQCGFGRCNEIYISKLKGSIDTLNNQEIKDSLMESKKFSDKLMRYKSIENLRDDNSKNNKLMEDEVSDENRKNNKSIDNKITDDNSMENNLIKDNDGEFSHIALNENIILREGNFLEKSFLAKNIIEENSVKNINEGNLVKNINEERKVDLVSNRECKEEGKKRKDEIYLDKTFENQNSINGKSKFFSFEFQSENKTNINKTLFNKTKENKRISRNYFSKAIRAMLKILKGDKGSFYNLDNSREKIFDYQREVIEEEFLEKNDNEKVVLSNFHEEKIEIDLAREVLGWSVSESEAKELLLEAKGNIYILDLAHELMIESNKKIYNFIAYMKALIRVVCDENKNKFREEFIING